MRVVVWNCCGGFERKFSALEALRPDIAIVPEVRANALARLQIASERVAWIGGPGGKGLALLTFGEWRVEQTEFQFEDQHFLPAIVRYRHHAGIPVLTDWTLPASDYVAPLLRTLNSLRTDLLDSVRLVAGDFNANVIWDAGKRKNRFREALDVLAALELESAWHTLRQEPHGTETSATLHFQRKRERPYQIDYLFAPPEWLKANAAVTIGSFDEWIGKGLSDHLPLIVDLHLPAEYGDPHRTK